LKNRINNNKRIADLLSVKIGDRVNIFYIDYYGHFNNYEFGVKGVYEIKLDYKVDAIIDINLVNTMLDMNGKITNLIFYFGALHRTRISGDNIMVKR
jgi:ABC-type lipoprotein release transport system permease subunit